MTIKLITVTSENSEIVYRVGVAGVAEIKIADIIFTGDPFSHYCGFDAEGKMMFSISCLVPCVVEYTR